MTLRLPICPLITFNTWRLSGGSTITLNGVSTPKEFILWPFFSKTKLSENEKIWTEEKGASPLSRQLHPQMGVDDWLMTYSFCNRNSKVGLDLLLPAKAGNFARDNILSWNQA